MHRLKNLKKSKRQAGFTLLEICVAIMVLGYAMLIVARLFASVTMSSKTSEFGTLANNYARAKMEDIINREYDTLPVGSWTPDPWGLEVSQTLAQNGILIFTRQVTITYMQKVSGVLSPSASDLGLKRVEVKVSWNERGRVQEIILTSLVAKGV